MLETAIQLMGAQAPRNLVPMLEGKGTGTGSEDEETELEVKMRKRNRLTLGAARAEAWDSIEDGGLAYECRIF
jgi:hypothetical protein